MPFMRCSMTCVTVSSSVLDEAPGQEVETLTWSGAMAGYWETGRRTIESAPASITRMPITQAKIGRSMKKRATALPRAGGGDGVHERARADLLEPFHDDLVAGPEPVG